MCCICTCRNISIHVPREGDDRSSGYPAPACSISIHVPREGDDHHRLRRRGPGRISIHVPREGDDPASPVSTCGASYFYPRPPRGGRPDGHDLAARDLAISIHVPREGDDAHCQQRDRGDARFLSTSPARGTTYKLFEPYSIDPISIHVPREGDDRAVRGTIHAGRKDFYPRPPRGGRRDHEILRRRYLLFLSTSPARGTTARSATSWRGREISIHVPREGDDPPADRPG